MTGLVDIVYITGNEAPGVLQIKLLSGLSDISLKEA